MRNIGVPLVGMQNQLPHVIEGKTQAAVESALFFQASFYKPGIDQFAINAVVRTLIPEETICFSTSLDICAANSESISASRTRASTMR